MKCKVTLFLSVSLLTSFVALSACLTCYAPGLEEQRLLSDETCVDDDVVDTASDTEEEDDDDDNNDVTLTTVYSSLSPVPTPEDNSNEWSDL